ncbi:MAG TPA: STAS domain-containing protein [Actinocrinis sp.]|nr:STAS domain-containing protein [Actinocrinis sp.]
MNEYLLDSTGAIADMMPGFTVREDFGHTIIRAVGEIDAYSAPALTATIRKQIRDGHHRLIVDLSGVPFMDSSGLGALVGGYKRVKVHPDGRFAVVGACKRFLEVLRITGLVRVLPVYESLGHVIQAYEIDPHAAARHHHHHTHHLGRHAATAAAVSIPSPTPAPDAALAAPALACDRDTLLHLAGLGDVDALVERSLLFGSEAQRAAIATGC